MVNDTLTHFQINNGVNSLFYFRILADRVDLPVVQLKSLSKVVNSLVGA